MQKQIEISSDNTITATQIRQNLLRLRGVMQCIIAGPQTVRVIYNEKQIQAKLIVKRAGYLRTQRRPARILSVRDVTPVNQPS